MMATGRGSSRCCQLVAGYHLVTTALGHGYQRIADAAADHFRDGHLFANLLDRQRVRLVLALVVVAVVVVFVVVVVVSLVVVGQELARHHLVVVVVVIVAVLAIRRLRVAVAETALLVAPLLLVDLSDAERCVCCC